MRLIDFLCEFKEAADEIEKEIKKSESRAEKEKLVNRR